MATATEPAPVPMSPPSPQHAPVGKSRDEFHKLVKSNQLEEVRQAIDERPSLVNKLASNGIAPLQVAAMRGHLEVVKVLLEHKANVDFHNRAAASPLFLACAEGHLEVAKVLIEAGANVNFLEETSLEHPLHAAAAAGFKNIVELLVSHQAKLNDCDEEGRTPLTRAIRNRRHEVVAYLRSVGATDNSDALAEQDADENEDADS